LHINAKLFSVNVYIYLNVSSAPFASLGLLECLLTCCRRNDLQCVEWDVKPLHYY